MTLHIEDKWIWDFWFAHNSADTHIFYLQAPRSLGNPDLRHWHSSIGHAVSKDLMHWEMLPDAIHPSDYEDDWDSMTTWTGSTIFHADTWYMFYTGTSKVEEGLIQRIGLATSSDLIHWNKYENNPIIEVDPRWYELLDKELWYEQAWRDPWIFYYQGKFQAFITARSKFGHPKERGVIGYASSEDLLNWEVREPLTNPGEFAYLEVPQLIEMNDRWYLLFCVESTRYSDGRRARKGEGINTGTHYMIADDPFGPFIQPENDLLFGDKAGSYYSGKIIQNNEGDWMFMTAIQYDQTQGYVGDISDPYRLKITKDKQLAVMKR